jgi:hypothetical protein
MQNEKPQVFIDIGLAELSGRVEDYDARGWRFVNICGSTVAGGVELIYSFSDGLPLENLRLTVGDGATVPSVSERFPNAFFFENETHDLFGVRFSGISIDFDGNLYTVAVPTPMNPRSAEAREAAADGSYGAADYGRCPVPESATGAVAGAGAAAGAGTAAKPTARPTAKPTSREVR